MQKTIVGIAVLVVLVGAIVFFTMKTDQPPLVSDVPSSVASLEQTFSMAEIQEHKDASSCFTLVNGVVYDVTSWINSHPGGKEAIISMCGKDSTAAFMLQHGDNKKIADILAAFKIGVLAQ